MMKKLVVLLAILALGIWFIPSVHAVAFGASPAILTFEVRPGGSETKTFQISTNSETDLHFTVTKSSELADFAKLSKTSGNTKLGQPAELSVAVKVPSSTKLGTYEGVITATTAGEGESGGGSGSVISTGVAVKVVIVVSNTAKSSDHVTGSFLGVGAKNIGFGAVAVILAIVIVALAVVFAKRPRNKTMAETWR